MIDQTDGLDSGGTSSHSSGVADKWMDDFCLSDTIDPRGAKGK